MLTILRLLSTLAALIQLAGLLLRVALVGLIGVSEAENPPGGLKRCADRPRPRRSGIRA